MFDIFGIKAKLASFDQRLNVILVGISQLKKDNLEIKKELKRIMTDQEKLDAIAASEETEIAALGAAVSGINTSAKTIADEIAALKAQPTSPALDFSKAEAALADLNSGVTAAANAGVTVAGLEPAPPTPTTTEPTTATPA